MHRRTWDRYAMRIVFVLLAMLTGGNAAEAGWAEGLFQELNHDFGPVPRGSKVRHDFVLTNRSNEPVTILDVRASCGCTTGKASSPIVQSGQSAVVTAEMDTRNFVGRKATVLFVTLVTATGRQSEVRLGVVSTILSDIVFNPGTIDFGVVNRGQPAIQTLAIDRIGTPAWRVERMISACRSIDASLVETARDAQRVSYELKVSVKPDATAGLIRDEIRLVTNDREAAVFAVQVSALIRGELTASPSVLSLGRVASTAVARGKFLVRASRPFTIRAIEGDGDGFKAAAEDGSAKAVHLISITHASDPGTTRGDLRRVFRVTTDLAGESPLDLTVTLHVDP